MPGFRNPLNELKLKPTMLKNFYLAICFVFCLINNLQAQKLTGTIVDEKGLPLALANVSLLRSSGNGFQSGVVTDSSGRFSMTSPAAGNYLLRVTAIGFAEFKTVAFDVPSADFSKDFGSLTLKQDVKALKDITVTAMRPMIIQKADRMVVSIEGTAMAAGNNAFSILSKVPGVFVDQEGNIQLNGRGGVTVMLDGKLTYLSARDLRNLLEGMPAENLKNIEVITNPSAKYDAEGTSGILNINLKKNTQQGINGSISAGFSTNLKQNGYTYGTSINHKAGKWNSFLSLDASKRFNGREATFTRIFYAPGKTTYFDQTAVGNSWGEGPPFTRLGTDYSFTNNHSVGFVMNYATAHFEDEFLTETLIGNAPKEPKQFINADNFSKGMFRNFTSNFHYVGKLDTFGTTLSTDLDYVNIKNRREGFFYNYFNDLTTWRETKDFLYTNIPSGYDIYSGKIDYSKSFKGGNKIEFGAKASHVISDNDSRFYFNNGSRVPDPLRTNHFNFSENIYAAYLNWSGDLSKKLSAQAGLRAEQTEGTGKSFTTGQVNNRSYLDFFPSLFLQQKVNDNYGINYSYSRRLTRPNYGNLNPFRSYRDPYTWTEGNPSLRPTYTHLFMLSQVFRKSYTLLLYYQLNKDVMTELPILDVANNTTIYTTGNLDNSHNVGLNAIAPLKIRKWWDTQNTVVVSYNKFKTQSNNGQLTNEQLFASLQSNHTILLPGSVRMEMNISLLGPRASGLYHQEAMSRVDVALKRSFLNKKFDLTINANDVFKGYRFLWTTNIGGNVNEFDQYLRWRNMGINLRYNFSKGQKVDVKRRNNTVEEMSRT
jgi:hypothetical protein